MPGVVCVKCLETKNVRESTYYIKADCELMCNNGKHTIKKRDMKNPVNHVYWSKDFFIIQMGHGIPRKTFEKLIN